MKIHMSTNTRVGGTSKDCLLHDQTTVGGAPSRRFVFVQRFSKNVGAISDRELHKSGSSPTQKFAITDRSHIKTSTRGIQ